MSLFYITGAPGTGKSTIEAELKKRGYEAYDIDQTRFGGPVNIATGQSTVVPSIEKRSPEWFDEHEWRVSRRAIRELKEQSKDTYVYLCGTAFTEKLVWDLFDRVLYLNIDEATLRSRVLGRNNGNDFGKTDSEMQLILDRYKSSQDNLKSLDANTVVIDAAEPLNEVVDTIIREAML